MSLRFISMQNGLLISTTIRVATHRIGVVSTTFQSLWRKTLMTYTFFSFRFLWPRIVSKLWIERERERENQQDAKIRCLLSTLSQHVSGIIMPILRRTKTVCYCLWCAALVLLDVVGSSCGELRCRVRTLCLHPTTQRPTTATNHIQQNQRSTPHAVTHGLCSPKMVIMMPETCWDSVDNTHLIVAYCWFSLFLHNLTYTFI